MADPLNTPIAVPDVSRPRRRVPEWVWWTSALIAVGAFGATALVLKSRQQPDEAPTQSIITSSEIPDDFFKSAQKPPAAAEEPAPEKPVPAPKAPAPMVQVAAQKITATELFTAPPVAPVVVAPDLAGPINDARRTAGAARVAKSGRLVDPSEWINTQEDFEDEQKTEASYPTDLSRVVTANRFIPALLVNAIDSELAGKVVATIEENVYGAHGRNILIPAGSQAVGRYKALAKPGDERIMIIWSRIITPDGINMHLADAEMADAMGRSGLTGDVDNRFFDRYGMALLVSTLSALTAYKIPVTNQGQQVVVQAYGSNIADLSSQILEKNINLKPKLSLPAGQRILISPQRDIWFKKPERSEVQVLAFDSASKPQLGSKR